MTSLESFVDQIYTGQERLTRDEIKRRAVAAELTAETMAALDALPEGEYAQDEVAVAIVEVAAPPTEGAEGVPPITLTDQDLLRELGTLHRTRHETLRHGSDHALQRHSQRTEELEREYLGRFPDREVEPERHREGAREQRD
jgi:hypothetical protein